jgi:hypothetical protein
LWITEGSVDFLAPQIYFTIGREPTPPNTFDSPDFTFLVDEWVNASQGKPIFAGLGPYKPLVFDEMDTQIAASRTEGARGQVYFRYEHILPFDFETSYSTSAIPWPMSHRFLSFRPDAPGVLDLTAGTDISGDPQYTLDWPTPGFSEQDPIGVYSIFRSEGRNPDLEDPNDLLELVHGSENAFVDTGVLPGVEYRYQIAAHSRLGKMSDPSPIATIPIVAIDDDPAIADVVSVKSIYPNPASERISVEFTAPVASEISFRIFDLLGRELLRVSDWRGSGGSSLREVDIQFLSAGTYIAQISSLGHSDSKVFVIHP